MRFTSKGHINLFSLFSLSLQDNDGKITRKEIEELLKNLGGEIDCPHVQVRILFLVKISVKLILF